MKFRGFVFLVLFLLAGIVRAEGSGEAFARGQILPVLQTGEIFIGLQWVDLSKGEESPEVIASSYTIAKEGNQCVIITSAGENTVILDAKVTKIKKDAVSVDLGVALNRKVGAVGRPQVDVDRILEKNKEMVMLSPEENQEIRVVADWVWCPHIVVESSGCRLVERDNGTVRRHEMVIWNKGQEPLIIKNVHEGERELPFSEYHLSAEEIRPGSNAVLSVTYPAGGMLDSHVPRNVYIESNDPKTPKLYVQLDSRSVNEMFFEPGKVVFYDVNLYPQRVEREALIVNKYSEPIQITKALYPTNEFNLSWTPVQSENQTNQLLVRVQASSEAGHKGHESVALLLTRGRDTKLKQIPLFVDFVEDLLFEREIYVRSGAIGRVWRVKSRLGRPIKVLEAEVPESNVDVRVTPAFGSGSSEQKSFVLTRRRPPPKPSSYLVYLECTNEPPNIVGKELRVLVETEDGNIELFIPFKEKQKGVRERGQPMNFRVCRSFAFQ